MPLDVVSLDETQEMQLDHIDKVRARTGDSDIAFTLMLSTANMDDQDINLVPERARKRFGTLNVSRAAPSQTCRILAVYSRTSRSAGNGGDVEGIEENE